MLVSLNREGFVAPLIQMPHPNHPIVGMISLRMRQADPLAEPTHLTVNVWSDHQVPMIRHQTVTQQRQIEFAKRFSEQLLE